MADLDLSGRRLGEFVLQERIGAGGYGTVYRCEQPALKRDAVVKVLHGRRRRNDAAERRFLREAQLASRLDHPYAAHVYSFGVEDDGLLWIAMELVQGVTLGEWLRMRGPMPLEEFVPFFERVAQVVQAAHERGIVHRDLKPSNMMVIESGGRLFPKLLDFGIAKLNDGPDVLEEEDITEPPAVHDGVATIKIRIAPPSVQRTRTEEPLPGANLTRPGVVMGSAPYMSPEQWGAPYSVGPSTDIYSLGCVAYEALTGRAPFTAENTSEYYEQHRCAEPPPLETSFSRSLDLVLQRALAKSPQARHATALELASDLRAALRAEPREQLRSSAQQWNDRARPPGLLWGRDVLADVERWTRTAPSASLTELECSFVAASQRRARRIAWVRRLLVALAALGIVALFQYRSTMQTRLAEQQAHLAEQQARSARQLAEARITESELEQGRAALLHGEPEAQGHLVEAYKRDPAPTTAFMLARSMQPRLAELARFTSTYGRMWWAAFSPDGRQIVTTDDRAAQLWDAQTYQLLATLPHGCEVYQAVFSADGTRLVTAAETMVRIWDPISGALIHDLKLAPGPTPSDYFRVAISPDGRLIAASNAAGSVVHVWDAASGTRVAELRNDGADYAALAFSPEGWLAITGGNEARVFATTTWKHALTIPGSIRSLAFEAQGRLVTGAATGDVTLWSVPSGTKVHKLRQFGEPVETVAFSPDGKFVAAGSRDGMMQAWHVDSGGLQTQLNPRRSKILAVEFDPTSRLLLAANADGTVVVADIQQGLSIAQLDGPRNVVFVARFDRHSRVVGASWDGTARLWDATPPYRRWGSEPMSDGCGIVGGAAPDGRFVAVGCGVRPTRVWDTSNDQLLAELPNVTQLESGGFISAFPAVSSDGARAAVARGNTTEVYDLPTGRALKTIQHGAPVSAVTFGEGGAVASGAIDGSVHVTQADGNELALQGSGGVDAVEVLPDGRVLVADAQRRLRLYSANGAVVTDLEMPARIISLRREGTRLVALPSYSGPAAPPPLIDLDRPRVIAQLDGHVGLVWSARWVSGGRILTAGADGTARMWDGTSGQPLQVYRGGSRFLADALLSGSMVIAGDADGQLRFWDEASGARLWTLPVHKSAVIGIHVDGEDIVTRGFAGEVSRWRLPNSEQVLDACSRHVRCAIVPR